MARTKPTARRGKCPPFTLRFGSIQRKRPHSALAEPDSDHEEDTTEPQLVSAFDHSGAIISNGSPKTNTSLLVIQAEKNKDWREESRKRSRKNLLPAEVQAAQSLRTSDVVIPPIERNEVSKVSGIQFVHRDHDGDTTMARLEAAQRNPEQAVQPTKTVDEEALEALLGGEKKSTLHIPALPADDQYGYDPSDPANSDYANEDDRFKADVASRPDVASLEDYTATPVEDFGAALLRGMGWKDGEAVGKRRAGAPAPKNPVLKERRPNLLGIGAKEVPGGVGDEFGAWGKVANGKRKTDLTYSPVLLKNTVTGELLTEEELVKKKEQQAANKNKGGEDDWRERRDRNLKIDAVRKSDRLGKERLALEDVATGEKNKSNRDARRRERTRDDDRRRDRSPSNERRRGDRSRDYEGRTRDKSREGVETRYSSSRRHSRSRERSHHHGSSRRERSRSAERRHRRH
jgi:hypothetical protein